MSITHQQLDILLTRLESELRIQMLWSSQKPSKSALSSQLPFCYDTLTFSDWLQWIFTPQMKQLIDLGLPLPLACSMAPMAEIAYKDKIREMSALISLLQEIDALLTENPDKPS